MNKNISRRRFLQSTTLGSIALFYNPLQALAANTFSSDKVARIVAKSMAIDAHNHMDMPFDAAIFKTQHYNLAAALKTSGLTAISMTFCVDRPKLQKKGEAFDRFILSLDEMDSMLKDNTLKRALHYSDIEDAHQNNKTIVVQAVEGGHFIEDQLERIEIAYNRGLRHLGLLHDNPSFVPLGDIYTNTPQFNGLTKMGKEVVKECNRLGILVDTTHCSDKTINDVLEISSSPVIASHTGLNTQLGTNEKMANMMLPRLIKKEQAKIIAEAGGVIGVWTHLADTPADYANNIKAMVDAVGIKHVCIGTDTKMTTANNKQERFGKTTNEAWDTSVSQGFYYTVVESLLKAGFTEKDIIKIGGQNYWRVFKEAVG